MTPVLFSCSRCRRKYTAPVDPCPYCSGGGIAIKGTGDWVHGCPKLLGHVAVTPHMEPCRYCGAMQERVDKGEAEPVSEKDGHA